MTRKVYTMDANIFITLQRYYPQSLMPDLWNLLDDLVRENSLLSHEFVYAELVPDSGPRDEVGTWAMKNKHCFHPITSEQTNLLPIILRDFPKLINPNNLKNQADPWLIAQAMEHQKNPQLIDPFEIVVVTDENRNSPHKLPAACEQYRIPQINRFEFFSENGFQFSVSRK